MANSGQNFLDLLFGGVDKGINQFRQQQGQQADLALTIQQMLRQQKQRAEDVAFRDKTFEVSQGAARAATSRQAGLDVFNANQQNAENYIARSNLDINRQQLEIERTKANAPKGTIPADIQKFIFAKQQGYEGDFVKFLGEARGGGVLLNAASLARHRADYAKLQAEYRQTQISNKFLKNADINLPDAVPPPATFDEYLDGVVQAGSASMGNDEFARMLEEYMNK